MATAHLSVRAHSRTGGHSVAAALAYRFGSDLTDARTGVEHRYARRGEAIEVGAVGFCHGATKPAWPLGAQAWVDALERAERRSNSIVCRDVTVALPTGLSLEQAIALTIDTAQSISDHYDCPTAWALHPAPGEGDARNWHAHILMATRALDPETGLPGRKLREFHIRSRAESREQDSAREQQRTDNGGSAEITRLRTEWERICNAHLAAAGRSERITMGRTRDPRDRRPVLTHGEVMAERILWGERHPDTPLEGVSVRELVLANYTSGGCQSRRGRLLAQHELAQGPHRAHGGYHSALVPALEPGEIELAVEAAQTLQPLPDPPAPTPAPKRGPRLRRRRQRRVRNAAKLTAEQATPAPTHGPACTATQSPSVHTDVQRLQTPSGAHTPPRPPSRRGPRLIRMATAVRRTAARILSAVSTLRHAPRRISTVLLRSAEDLAWRHRTTELTPRAARGPNPRTADPASAVQALSQRRAQAEQVLAAAAHAVLTRALTPRVLEWVGECQIDQRDPDSARADIRVGLGVDPHTRDHVLRELEVHTAQFRARAVLAVAVEQKLADWRAWWGDGGRGQRIAREIFARVWPTHRLEQSEWETADPDEQAKIRRELDDQAARRKRERETAEQAARAPPRSMGFRRD